MHIGQGYRRSLVRLSTCKADEKRFNIPSTLFKRQFSIRHLRSHLLSLHPEKRLVTNSTSYPPITIQLTLLWLEHLLKLTSRRLRLFHHAQQHIPRNDIREVHVGVVCVINITIRVMFQLFFNLPHLCAEQARTKNIYNIDGSCRIHSPIQYAPVVNQIGEGC